MIKCKKGDIKIKGTTNEIKTDLTCIFRALSEENIIKGEKDVVFLYRLACMDESVVDDLANSTLQELKDKLEDIFR